jgi:hypothetical protein
MRTDIVSRLQAEAESNPLFSEAAHEIERLRTALHELAFRAIDAVSETTPYKIRKKYAKDARSHLDAKPPNEDAKAVAREKARAKRSRDRDECTDRHIKLMLCRHGKIRYRDITPELVQLKRDQLAAERLSRQLTQAVTTKKGTTE